MTDQRISKPAKATPKSHSFSDVANTTADLWEVVSRQRWLIAACVSIGFAAATVYWVHSAEWYESSAKMLVTLKDPRMGSSGEASWNESSVNEDVLANHIEIVRSRRIIESALSHQGLSELPSILEKLDDETDAVDYVSDQLKLTKGGQGSARNARSLNIGFEHTNAKDAQAVLQAVVLEYESFLDEQLDRIMSEANKLVLEAQLSVERDLKDAETRYVTARKDAPLLYQGEGSSNVFLDKFRRLQDELVSVEIEQSTVGTRLAKVYESLASIDADNGTDLDRLALIDTDSLERLGVFAGLQVSAANSAGFQASQPARLEEARTEYSHMLKLMSEASRLEANFGPQHPEVVNLRDQIKLAKSFIKENEGNTTVALDEMDLTPELLLNAYTGFLKHDLASLSDRKRELEILAKKAEHEAKELVEFELQDKMLSSAIERKQALYDSIVDQLRNLDTASGLSGYVHEVLESPRMGERVWPDLKMCGLAGVLLGLMGGLALAMFNDMADERFRSPADVDASIGLPVIGRVGRLRKARGKQQTRMIVDAQAPEAEAFRLIRTYLQKDVRNGTNKVFSLTSSQTKDGKSTIVANIGACFADLGLKVLIIDGDMRAPTAHKFFNIPVNNGLSEVLRGAIAVTKCFKHTDVKGVRVLTAGAAVKNPAELLDSVKFDDMLKELRELFDLIVVDSGPVLRVSDPAIISQKVDSTLLVVRTSRDTKKQVKESIKRLKDSGSNMLGCIVNSYGSNKEFTNDAAGSYYYYYGRREKNGSAKASKFTSTSQEKPKV